MVPAFGTLTLSATAVAADPMSGEGPAGDRRGRELDDRALSLSATKMSPAASAATPVGRFHPVRMVATVPFGKTSLIALLPVSATKTSPAAFTATPAGLLNPEPMVRIVPSDWTSLIALLPVSATTTSPYRPPQRRSAG